MMIPRAAYRIVRLNEAWGAGNMCMRATEILTLFQKKIFSENTKVGQNQLCFLPAAQRLSLIVP